HTWGTGAPQRLSRSMSRSPCAGSWSSPSTVTSRKDLLRGGATTVRFIAVQRPECTIPAICPVWDRAPASSARSAVERIVVGGVRVAVRVRIPWAIVVIWIGIAEGDDDRSADDESSVVEVFESVTVEAVRCAEMALARSGEMSDTRSSEVTAAHAA